MELSQVNKSKLLPVAKAKTNLVGALGATREYIVHTDKKIDDFDTT